MASSLIVDAYMKRLPSFRIFQPERDVPCGTCLAVGYGIDIFFKQSLRRHTMAEEVNRVQLVAGGTCDRLHRRDLAWRSAEERHAPRVQMRLDSLVNKPRVALQILATT